MFDYSHSQQERVFEALKKQFFKPLTDRQSVKSTSYKKPVFSEPVHINKPRFNFLNQMPNSVRDYRANLAQQVLNTW